MRYGSICSGIEAATVAWHPLGWEPQFFSDIEPFPRALLQHHYPQVPLHGDFTTIEADTYGPIDLLVGGTPCQSFSIAGLRKGMDDDRGNLALEYLRLAQRLSPKWLVWENVPGVLSSSEGRDFGAFLGGLVQLGYGFAYRVLDAQHFGVPQRRRRVFVVGCAGGDWRRAAAVLFERESLSGNPAPSREAREVAPTIPSRSTGGGGLGTDFDCDGGLIPTHDVAHPLLAKANDCHREDAQSYVVQPYKVANCLTARTAKGMNTALNEGQTPVITVHGTQDPDVLNDCAHTLGRNNGSENAICFSCKDHGADAGDLAPTMRAMGHDGSHANGGGQLAVAIAENQRGELRTSDVVTNITVGGGKPGQGYPAVAFSAGQSAEAGSLGLHEEQAPTLRAGASGTNQVPTLMHEMSVRRLTPVECERLQGFPDNYTQVPYRGKSASDCPDGPRYKALGNSFAVPVVRWIGERIQMVDQIPCPEVAVA